MAVTIDEFIPDQIAVFKHNGWDFHVKVEIDEGYASPDHLGTFQSESEACAVDHHEHSSDPRAQNDHCRWFIPANTAEGHIKSGATKEEAERYVMEDYRRADTFGRDWHYVDMIVYCYKLGVELGLASLCQIETDSDASYFQQTLESLVDEAQDMAEKKLAELKEV